MKILWLSANILGINVFPDLIRTPGIEIAGIVTLSSKSPTVMYDGVDPAVWKQFGIPVHEVVHIGDEEELIRGLAPDLVIMCGWRQRIPSSLISLIPRGIIGFHPTLLPIGRGPAPIINSILEGFSRSGVTMFYLEEELDSGDIIGQVAFDITADDYAHDLYLKVIGGTRELIQRYMPLLVGGESPRTPQDHQNATFFPKRTLADNEINIGTDDPIMIYRKIRAFSSPYRGAFIRVNGEKLTIWKASLCKEET
jgi:methionyl-tRNA formyltransferase